MDELKNLIIVIAITIVITLTIFIIVIPKSYTLSYGQQNEIHTNQSSENAVLNANETSELQEEPMDLLDPFINITYPSYPPTLLSGNITLRGITNDSSGIKAISADAHTFPFNGTMPIKPAFTPSLITEKNWSKWSIPFVLGHSGVYRIVVTVRDNADNLGYAETTVNVVSSNDSSGVVEGRPPRIAFVRSTFTEAAYQQGGFYSFYFKYGFPDFGKKISTDLDMLTVKTPKSVSEFLEADDLTRISNLTAIIPINGTELHDISYDDFPNPQRFWIPFIDRVKMVRPDATLTVMRDEDVHDGHIFYPGENKTNAFDILLLFHNEYVTQTEYDNLKQFVANGGTIVFIDANALYAEVRYDKDNNTITLVKGHNWKFDGEAASRGVSERWYNEAKKWVGSNYLVNAIEPALIFTNNLFNYTHFEEQYVNNPNAKIIIDYGVKFPADYVEIYSKKNELPLDKELSEVVVATYSLHYGKGKVIGLGLTARNLSENQEFMKFFENVILPEALCPRFISCYSP